MTGPDRHPLSPDAGGSRRRRLLAAGGAGLGALVLGVPAVDDRLVRTVARSPLLEWFDTVRSYVPNAPSPDGWYPGDLHAHTDHSHDVCGSLYCDAPETFGYSVTQQILAAELRGLSYLAITDHDTVAAQTDSGYTSDIVTLLDGYEHTLDSGHAGVIGVGTTLERPTPDDEAVRNLFSSVRDRGGAGVVNHPRTDISSRWEYRTPAGADAVEVWSIAWYLQERTGAGPLASNNPRALRLYDRFLNAGHRLAVVGGSDNHWRSSSMLQGVGQPTTWIQAASSSQSDLLEGIRAGRTSISWDWLGPVLELSCETAAGEVASIGDTVPADGPLEVTVRVTNGVGHRVRLVRNGEVLTGRRIGETPASWTVEVEPGSGGPQGWIRAEAFLEEHIAMRALTSPVYLTADGTAPTPRSIGLSHPSGEPTATTGCGCHTREQRRAFAKLDLPLGEGRDAASIDYATVSALEAALPDLPKQLSP